MIVEAPSKGERAESRGHAGIDFCRRTGEWRRVLRSNRSKISIPICGTLVRHVVAAGPANFLLASATTSFPLHKPAKKLTGK